MSLTLVLGGIRSGKSVYAERLVKGSCAYVATMRPIPDDRDLDTRIERHRRRRPAEWTTIEATTNIAAQVAATGARTALLDGFGLVVAAALDSPDPAATVAGEIGGILGDSLLRDWIVVSEEVGLSLIAGDATSRRFQDLLGEANQTFASMASLAVLVVAGRAILLPNS